MVIALQYPFDDIVVVVIAIQAQVMQAIDDFLGSGHGDPIQCFQRHGLVMSVGARHHDGQRRTALVAQRRPFGAQLTRSTGEGPVASPPNGALVMIPSRACHFQAMPIFLS